MTKLALGTASFGMDYRGTKVSDHELSKILNVACNDIDFLDTSHLYGDAYERISPYWYADICYKFHPYSGVLPICKPRYAMIHADVSSTTYKNLRQKTGIDLGVSSYSPKKLDLLEPVPPFVQIPINIKEHNFKDFMRKNPEVKIHARSVFGGGHLLQRGYSIKDCLKSVIDYGVDSIVVGVQTSWELEEIIDAYKNLV